jgi:cyclopropane-fatty-acyl-phospholipid synthase
MNTTTASPASAAAPRRATAATERVLRLLERLPVGQIELHLPGSRLLRLPSHPGAAADGETPRAALNVRDMRLFERIWKSGDIGLAEGYIDGDWDTPDLAALLRLCIANRAHIEAMVYGSWWGRLAYRLRHLLRRNTRAGSEKNIHAHYDLGNDFYRLWLDPSMNYSAAWFEGREAQGADLQQAQLAKVRRALREARVAPGARLLQVGCGWGGHAHFAPRQLGAHLTGETQTKEHLKWGHQKLPPPRHQEPPHQAQRKKTSWPSPRHHTPQDAPPRP